VDITDGFGFHSPEDKKDAIKRLRAQGIDAKDISFFQELDGMDLEGERWANSRTKPRRYPENFWPWGLPSAAPGVLPGTGEPTVAVGRDRSLMALKSLPDRGTPGTN
jgi:hypothetical protein